MSEQPVTPPPTRDLVRVRKNGANSALFFVHGFTGTMESTWGDFPRLIVEMDGEGRSGADPDLLGYDVFSWGYPSKLIEKRSFLETVAKPLLKRVWSDDPDIETIGRALRTMLDTEIDKYQRIVLVGHSMGGLAIQAFIANELRQRRRDIIDKLAEVVFLGTPSGGLEKARAGAFLKNQIADMSSAGTFIKNLRVAWKELVEAARGREQEPVRFQLTTIAGERDVFVPQESSIGPFPLDEKEFVPGDHTEMVKPTSRGDRVYKVLKKRLTRHRLTLQEWEHAHGATKEVRQQIGMIETAVSLHDCSALKLLAERRLMPDAGHLPLVDRALGLALLGCEEYKAAEQLLERYLDFTVEPENTKPFAEDIQAAQQRAIAVSGTGGIADSIALLQSLKARGHAESFETQGILGGRYKRVWRRDQAHVDIGGKARELYRDAFTAARNNGLLDAAFYNGINAAYMDFCLGGADYRTWAEQVRDICASLPPEERNYWSESTRAQAELLLGDYSAAHTAYLQARQHSHTGRDLKSTGEDALDILLRQGNPAAGEPVRALFS